MASIDAVLDNPAPADSSRAQRRDDDDASDVEIDALNIKEDSEGWNDVENDAEELDVRCLLCENISPSVKAMASHCQSEHDFDLIASRKRHALDFYGSIKFVNYVRSQANGGSAKPDVEDPAAWQDDKYLQPVLENDALLFSLDELDEAEEVTDEASNTQGKQTALSDSQDGSANDVAALKEQLSKLQAQFDAYRDQVSKTLEQRWTETPGKEPPTADAEELKYDKGYFESYSYNDIHQVMLQDRVRTDAYRDFIYDNKQLFQGKTVLDVGCGTGILSMFCAKAGAKKVFAVDNSAIIDKARQIAADNDLLSQITFVRGKVEDFEELPGGVREVDIIVSEWMGYCLFFENMLPSVLNARDRFMKRRADGSFDGLMVPSHCSVHLAPMADPEWVTDNVTFWNDVYGFDMKCMMEGALEDVVVQHPPAETVAGRTKDKHPTRVWDLHEATVEDLSFEVPFTVSLDKDIEALDAWCTWFDIVFSPVAPSAKSNATMEPADQERLAKQKGAITFSTGPLTKRTHWQCGVCVIDRKTKAAGTLASGTILEGKLTYAKGKESRALDVDIAWKSQDGKEEGSQKWICA